MKIEKKKKVRVIYNTSYSKSCVPINTQPLATRNLGLHVLLGYQNINENKKGRMQCGQTTISSVRQLHVSNFFGIFFYSPPNH